MLGAIGLIAMIVSGIGIANTMMMSINERTREVGVLKVLGTDLKDIAMMFLTEALLVGILGGIGGLLFKLRNGETDPGTLPDHAGEEYHPAVAGGRRSPVRRRGGTIIRTGTGTECHADQPQ